MFDATVEAVAEKAKAEAEATRWTQADELAALQAEITYLVFTAIVAANGGKRIRPLKIARPGAPQETTAVSMTHEQLMAAAREES